MKWYCKKLNRAVETSIDAMPDKDLGFLCDCGLWFDGINTWKTSQLNLGTDMNPNWVLRWKKISSAYHYLIGKNHALHDEVISK